MRRLILWQPLVLALTLLGTGEALCQQLSYLPLQRPGQASVAVDRAKHTAYVFDLGSDQDGREIQFEGKPLLDRLEEIGIEHIVFSCSHPHSDHMGGIKALFSDTNSFVTGEAPARARFKAITLIDDGVPAPRSLRTLIKTTVAASAGISIEWKSAREGNAFAGLSSAGDAVFVENLTYTAAAAAGVHGRSVIAKITLEGGHTIVDFDDADNAVVKQVAAKLKQAGTRVDSFVVPHHGSRFGDIEPILELHPTRAVIAVNTENRYGHPGGQLLEALVERLGADNVYFTGSTDATVFARDGIVSAAHTAAQRDSYAFFVQEAHTRAKARGDKAESEAYENVRRRMLSDTGDAAPDVRNAVPGIPSKGSQSPGSNAIAARTRERGSMHTPAFEVMHIKPGGTETAVVASHRVFGPGNPARTSTTTDASTPASAVSRSRSQRRARDQAVERVLATGAHPTGDIVATPETLAAVPSAVEASLVVTIPRSANGGPPAAPPKGGMVFLNGGNLHVSGLASELFGGTLDVCGTRLCIHPPGTTAAPYVLPFAAGRLFAEVWHRVAERRVESFYLSINPTKSYLQAKTRDEIPTRKLEFGRGSVKGHANEVVTAGEIDRSEIGRILWESDVAFKSASLGFDVLTGTRPAASPPTSLIQLADARSHDLELDPEDRWCRLYWSSGSQSIGVDPQTRAVSFRGNAVLARAEPMVLKEGELRDDRNGTWCSRPKEVAAALEREANGGGTRFPVLNRLRELAEMQTFAKWARDNGVLLGATVAELVTRSRDDLPGAPVPGWTSGIRSDPKVLIQQQTTSTSANASRLVHVSTANGSVFDDCVIPAWRQREIEFPAAGLRRKSDGKWEGDAPGFLSKWMTRLAARIAECSDGTVLPPTTRATEDPLSDPKREQFGIKPHAQPVHIHGGVLLGTRSNFLRSAWRDEGLLRTPDGTLVFKRIGDELHFWNYAASAGALTGVGQHVVVQGGTVTDSAVDAGSLRFVVSVQPQSVVRDEFRVESGGRFAAGLEWAGARHGSDGGIIIEKAAWRCATDDISCVGVADVPFGQLGALLAVGESTTPLLTTTYIDDGTWAIDLDISRVGTWYHDQWTRSDPSDTSGRLMLTNGMAQWGFEDAAEEAREELAERLEGESADTILRSVLTQSQVTFDDILKALRAGVAQEQLEDQLPRLTAGEALATLRRIEQAIKPLPAGVSADLYESLENMSERVLEAKVVSALTRKDLQNMTQRCRHERKVRQFLIEGATSPWHESERH